MKKGEAKNNRVLVIGRSCIDVISVIERFPEEDTKVPIYERTVEGGGQGATAACCIARLGGEVAYWGKIGDDEAGNFCLKRLRDFGVDTRWVEVVAGGKTPAAYIFITQKTGARTIFYEPSQLPPLDPHNLDLLFSPPPAVALLDPETTYLIEEIRNKSGDKTKIVYDGERWSPSIAKAMALADYFVPSCDFLSLPELAIRDLPFTEQIYTLAHRLAGQLVVTAGKRGAYYLEDGHLYHVLPPPVKVKDTTGAGDNFHAAFSFSISRGCSLSEAVKLAVSVASLSCRALGGRRGLPSLTEAREVAQALAAKPYP